MRLLTRLLEPKAVAHAHCDLPCGVYDPAQARIEAESVKAIAEKYGQNTDPSSGPGHLHQEQRSEVASTPLGAVDGLLQPPHSRSTAAAPAVQRGHQLAGASGTKGSMNGPRRRAAGQDRGDQQDLLGTKRPRPRRGPVFDS